MAASGGSTGLEAVAVLGEGNGVGAGDLAVLRDFAGSGVTVLLGTPDGAVDEQLST
jgi:hypothetical protein